MGTWMTETGPGGPTISIFGSYHTGPVYFLGNPSSVDVGTLYVRWAQKADKKEDKWRQQK